MGPSIQVIREPPHLDTKSGRQRLNEFAPASTHPEFVRPYGRPLRMLLVLVQEEHTHPIQVPEKTAHVWRSFVPVAEHKTGPVAMRQRDRSWHAVPVSSLPFFVRNMLFLRFWQIRGMQNGVGEVGGKRER